MRHTKARKEEVLVGGVGAYMGGGMVIVQATRNMVVVCMDETNKKFPGTGR